MRTGLGPLFAVVLANPELDNCPSAKMGCPTCSLAIAYLWARHQNQNDGPNGANQLFRNLQHCRRDPATICGLAGQRPRPGSRVSDFDADYTAKPGIDPREGASDGN